MKIASLALAATLLAGTAFAQGTAPTTPTPGNSAPGATSVKPMPGVSTSTGVTPATGTVGRNTGTAAASGDRNQAVATTTTNAPAPARGKNSFTMGQARGRLQKNGYQTVADLKKDNAGVWRGTASKDGQTGPVWVDYKGNVGSGDAASTAAR